MQLAGNLSKAIAAAMALVDPKQLHHTVQAADDQGVVLGGVGRPLLAPKAVALVKLLQACKVGGGGGGVQRRAGGGDA